MGSKRGLGLDTILERVLGMEVDFGCLLLVPLWRILNLSKASVDSTFLLQHVGEYVGEVAVDTGQ